MINVLNPTFIFNDTFYYFVPSPFTTEIISIASLFQFTRIQETQKQNECQKATQLGTLWSAATGQVGLRCLAHINALLVDATEAIGAIHVRL